MRFLNVAAHLNIFIFFKNIFQTYFQNYFFEKHFHFFTAKSSIPTSNQTSCTAYENGDTYLDRKLDYLFTNFEDGFMNGTTHQDAHALSDHAPVSATLTFP